MQAGTSSALTWMIGTSKPFARSEAQRVERASSGSVFDNAQIRQAIEATNRSTVLGASERSEHAALARMGSAGVVLSSVPAVLGELAVDFDDPRSQRAIALLMEL